MKKTVKNFLIELLIISIGWNISCVLVGYQMEFGIPFTIGMFTGLALEIRQRYVSICRENGGELPPRVLDKTDGPEIPSSTRTGANNADKSDISKKRGISATKGDQTTTPGHSTGR